VLEESTDNSEILSRCFASVDVPQADDLDKVRIVVTIATRGPMATGDIAAEASFSVRHVEYRLRAALLLGLLKKEKEGFVLTAAGKSLLATKTKSERERVTWLSIVEGTPVMASLAPDLFDLVPPSRDQLAERITRAADISRSTALRRAGAMLSWRRRLQSRQLELFPDLS
jgi:hypothetical protein